MLSEIQRSFQSPQHKQSKYALRRVLLGLPGGVGGETYQEWKKLTVDLWSVANQMKLTKGLEVDNFTAHFEDFVPGSHERFLSTKIRERWNKPFGQELE